LDISALRSRPTPLRSGTVNKTVKPRSRASS
jgi:hypothetical protein